MIPSLCRKSWISALEICSPSQLNCLKGKDEADTITIAYLEGAVGGEGGLSGPEIDWVNGVATDR